MTAYEAAQKHCCKVLSTPGASDKSRQAAIDRLYEAFKERETQALGGDAPAQRPQTPGAPQ